MAALLERAGRRTPGVQVAARPPFFVRTTVHAVARHWKPDWTPWCGDARTFAAVPSFWGADITPSIEHLEERLEAERRLLDEILQPWRTKYPQVLVENRMSRFDGALTETSSSAQMVVVGSRGSGIVAGSLCGSVSMHLLRHAACPVLVAHG